MNRPKPQRLFVRVFWMLSLILIVFQTFPFLITAYFVGIPLAKRSAIDLAALIHTIADRWEHTAVDERADFQVQIWQRHRLMLKTKATATQAPRIELPYITFLNTALTDYFPASVKLQPAATEPWFWCQLAAQSKPLFLGFPRSRIGTQPDITLVLVLLVNFMLIAVTATWVARYLINPLTKLASATTLIRRGRLPQTLPETGPQELHLLIREFNHMAVEVQELLANRTTLLAGVSHDLRSPLTRMQLAIEMLPENDSELIDQLRNDLMEMNRLIGEFLLLGKGLGAQQMVRFQFNAWVTERLSVFEQSGFAIQADHLPEEKEWHTDQLGLQRVLTNLVENADRYSEHKPITLRFKYEQNQAIIQVMDRGPGIPEADREAVFRPFFRLEPSRHKHSGGSGLGLAIVREITRLNAWSVALLPRSGGGLIAQLTVETHPETFCNNSAKPDIRAKH